MSCLVDRWVAFDQTRSGLEKWLSQFGDESTGKNLLARIEASGDINSVYEQIDGILKSIISQKMSKQALLRSAVQGSIIREEEEEQERVRAAQEEETQRKKKAEAAEEGAAAASDIDNKSAAAAKQSRSIAASKSSVRETSQLTIDDAGLERNMIDNDFKGVLMALWKQISSNYKSQMMKVLSKQRVQREEIEQHFYQI